MFLPKLASRHSKVKGGVGFGKKKAWILHISRV